MAQHTLESLLAEIGRSIKWAVDATDHFGLQSFMDQFEETKDANGNTTGIQPKTVQIPLPKPDGTYEPREIPTAALLHHSSLQIEDVRIKLHVEITEAEEGKPLRCAMRAARGEEARDKESISPTMAEIEVGFKRGDPAEGLARASSEFHKTI